MNYIEQQISELPLSLLVSLHNEVFGDSESYKIKRFSHETINQSFKTPSDLLVALQKLGCQGEELDESSYVRYDSGCNTLEVVTRDDIIDTCLPELAEYLQEQGHEIAKQFSIELTS